MAIFEINDWPWLVEFIFGLFLLAGFTRVVKILAFAWIETVRIQNAIISIDAEEETEEDTEEETETEDTVLEAVERQEAEEMAKKVANDDEDYPEHVEE